MDPLSQTFSALADPTRRAMLARLRESPATVNQLAEPFDLSLPTISRHLKVLEGAGLVSTTRDAQFRPRRLETGPLQEADQWISHYRAFFVPRFERLDNQLKSMMAARQDSESDPETGE